MGLGKPLLGLIRMVLVGHEGGDLQQFLQAEAERYRAQLTRYASIYRAYSGAAARCALYYPLLQEFVEVDVAAGAYS